MFRRHLIFVILIVVFVTLVAILLSTTTTGLRSGEQPLVVHIYPNVYVHERPFSINLSSNQWGVRIYYTLDGSEPNPASETSFLWRGRSLRYRLPDDENDDTIHAVVIRARAFSRDLQTYSPIVTKTYFYGHGLLSENFFHDFIVSIVADPVEFFDEEVGIMASANRNFRGRDSERASNVSFLEYGDVIFQQDVGLRLHGASSRGLPQKSMRITARRIYTPEYGTFRYPFFNMYYSATADRRPFTRFDSLIVRGPNQDLNSAFIRDEVGGKLASMAGIHGYQASRPVATYINGSFAGLSWLKPRQDRHFLAHLFGVEDWEEDNFDIMGFTDSGSEILGDRITVDFPDEFQPTQEEQIEIDKINDLFHSDLTIESNFQQFTEIFDIDNLLQHFAFKIAVSNHDWPYNNIRVWRYSGEQVGDSLDGRWRFLPFDFDMMLLLDEDPIVKTIMDDSLILRSLMARHDVREAFANYLNDYRAHILERDVLYGVIEEIHTIAKYELEYASTNSRWYAFYHDPNAIRARQLAMIDPAFRSATAIREKITEWFNLSGEHYVVRVTAPAGINVTLNSISTRGQEVRYFSTEYNIEHRVPLMIEPMYGFVIDEVRINDEVVVTNSEEKIEFELGADLTVNGNSILVSVIGREVTHNRSLMIVELDNDGRNDWVRFYNPNLETVELSNYCFTDDENDLCKWRLPQYSLVGQGEWTAHSRGSRHVGAWRQPFFPFNFSNGDELILSKYESREIVGRVIVPRVGTRQTFRYDRYRGFFMLTRQ
ncbi:MAG: CotH kinase family protein [Pseudomonadales bacterium]|nr:CotH kinase family protein [Pseudomonadales bacterium]